MRAPTWTSIGCGPSTRIVRCRFRVRAEDGFVARLIIGPHCPVVSGEFIRNRRLQQCSPYVSCRKIRTLALKRGELLRGAWTVSGEAGCAALGELAPADRIDHGPAQRSGGVDAIDLGAAEAEDLGLEVRRQRGIAVALAQLAVHGEAAERLELVLGGAVPDRIGAPGHTVFTDMAQQLAQPMRRRGRVAHGEAPRAAELGIDIAVGRDAVVDQRLDQAVDAALGTGRVERPLAPAGLEAGMVDDEADVGIKPRDAAPKLSPAMCVSLSTKTSLMKRSAEKQATGSASPQAPCGKLASACSQTRALRRCRQAPTGFTRCVCTSKMNSRPESASPAAAGSKAASLGRTKRPPALPRAAKAASRVSNVVAAPP